MCCRARRSCYERSDSGLRRGKRAVGGAGTAEIWRDAGTREHCSGLGRRERDCLAGPGAFWGGGGSRANVRGAVSPGKEWKLGSKAAGEFFEDGGMRLARRIIPCLDVDGARVVKGVNFVGLRDVGDPAELAARYNAEGADELVVLDIAAARDGRPTFLETIRRVAAELAIPLTAGGGIRSAEDARAVLRAG